MRSACKKLVVTTCVHEYIHAVHVWQSKIWKISQNKRYFLYLFVNEKEVYFVALSKLKKPIVYSLCISDIEGLSRVSVEKSIVFARITLIWGQVLWYIQVLAHHTNAATSSSPYSSSDNFRLLAYMIGVTLFFVITLLISFFLVILMINHMNIQRDIAPNLLMVGLVPPSIFTIIVFTKVLGRFSVNQQQLQPNTNHQGTH